jgi:hypothetical protein
MAIVGITKLPSRDPGTCVTSSALGVRGEYYRWSHEVKSILLDSCRGIIIIYLLRQVGNPRGPL